ncbi:MAG: hypothetical protein F4117_13095 [Acidimicrobiales bacterium]|nr:hypothetical protein [Acidimicrobiales bacterium]MXX42660.1 hypothetical protein [Acidimicrobiales bacterium]MXZ14490.1 hypothetical protein [Acidimicrobiales bacterium]MYA27319.1 hypothetical protein [Acidimicrobiales bacterium]MYA81946.1 hypothetical protein [Acidimicrobiales bacterium]
MEWSSVPPLLTVFVTIAIAFAGGVWAIIKWGFGGVNDRIDGVNGRIDGVVELINVRFDAVDYRFDAVDARFDAVDTKIDAVDKRVDAVDRRIDELRVDLRAVVNRVDALHLAIVPPAVGPA